MKNELPQRKTIRLQEYDYESDGAYFITICTKDKKALFSLNDSADVATLLVKNAFEDIIKRYHNVRCPIYVVMPNHFHAIIIIDNDGSEQDDGNGRGISDIVRAFKRRSTAQYAASVNDGVLPPFDKQIWQRSFYDHVIRNQNDYNEVFDYISENPLKWKLDKLYTD